MASIPVDVDWACTEVQRYPEVLLALASYSRATIALRSARRVTVGRSPTHERPGHHSSFSIHTHTGTGTGRYAACRPRTGILCYHDAVRPNGTVLVLSLYEQGGTVVE